MPDKRPVDDLSIEELEEVLRKRKRERQEERLRRLRESGRARDDVPLPETPARSAARPAPVPPSRRRLWTNRLLLGVEVVALVGFLYVIYLLVMAIQVTNAGPEAATGPAPTATALIDVVLLPSGHQPPSVAGGDTAPGEAGGVPEHLQNIVARTTPLPVPTAGPEQPRGIEITAIGVRAQVVEGDGWEQLKKGAGHHPGTANPGQKGNLVLSGHNDVFGQVFKDLDKLKPGDTIVVSTATQRYTYVVAATRIVAPTEVSVMLPTREASITLISCYPYLIDTQRIVVVGTLKP
jgi:sortase A